MKNRLTPTRRSFLGATAAAAAASPLSGLPAEVPGASPGGDPVALKARLAMASYSLRKFDLDQALAMTARLGLKAICLKAFHLALDADAATIAACVEKAKKAGIEIYGGGVINLKNEADVDHAFEYAKAAGMERIVGSPALAMLERVHAKVRESGIEVCIHNHGPGDKVWPTPELSIEKIAKLDPRIGFCHDVGHTTRLGRDAVAETKKCADRILDVHFKDVTEAKKSGHSIACGRGVIDLPGLLRTLLEIDYSGYLAFEYESDANDPLPGLAESVGYVRGVLDEMAAR